MVLSPRRSTQGTGGVPDGGPLALLPGGMDGSLATGTAASRLGTEGRTGRGPGPTRTLTATSNKYQFLAESAAVHSKWDGSGGTGMA